MTKLTLTNYALSNTTVLENEFIDRHMVKANGEYVKVYLLLLRHMNRPGGMMSVPEMADILECTENDVRRALRYWKKQELLDYSEQAEPANADGIASIEASAESGNIAAMPAERNNITVTPTGRIHVSGIQTGIGHVSSVSNGLELVSAVQDDIGHIPAIQANTGGMVTPTNADSMAAHTNTGGMAAQAGLDGVPAMPADTGTDVYPAASDLSGTNIQQYRNRHDRKEFKELMFVAEQYLGKTLSSADIDMITYFYDMLHMSAELIEYLIEYCVENGHKSMHYIRKVALSWNEQKITTVSEAKSSTVLYNKNCYSILNAYGIKGRAPAASEIAYIRRWNDEYGFSLDLILEACNRTMNAIHQPNFEYTDTILKNWLEKNVRHIKDVDVLDANYMKEKERRKKSAGKAAATAKNSKSNKFNNFSGRSYDMDSLERRLVQQ